MCVYVVVCTSVPILNKTPVGPTVYDLSHIKFLLQWSEDRIRCQHYLYTDLDCFEASRQPNGIMSLEVFDKLPSSCTAVLNCN